MVAMTASRSAVAAVLASVGLVSAGGCSASGGSAESCAPPRTVLSSRQVAPGDRLTVTVRFTVACQDTDPGTVSVVRQRWRAVRVQLVQGATQTLLATVDPDRDGVLSTQVTVPAGAKAGEAFIRVDHVDDALVLVG